ncbi:hypothetical protein MJO28_013387 [Puccinia striiformis f. sp. tritici]|uniref:Uncharacterized protein n=1 Tax=Puccinia striiformis f. sp. tritici TaxID=168172 RepID=A0ACC0DY63_9BASI|nr:hypothetical protein MJO28_013387 [Puccinia striiformis f. sp. tritici]
MAGASKTPSTPTGHQNVAQGQQSALRRSSRNTTPTSRLGTFGPASISRRPVSIPTSATQPPSSSQTTQSAAAPGPSKANKRKLPSSVASTAASVHMGKKKKLTKPSTQSGNVIDLAQDSDDGNKSIAKRGSKRGKDGFDKVVDYYGAPFHNPGDDLDDDPFTYECLHCLSTVRGALGTNSNLYSHRDGSRQKGRSTTGCPKRREAIAAGANLPPTVAEVLKMADSKKLPKINTFFCATQKFDNLILNRVLTLWLIRNALAWSRVEDIELQAAFHHAQPASKLYMRKWQA